MKALKYILLIALLVVLAVAGWQLWVRYELFPKEPPPPSQEQVLMEDFETFLNDFLKDTARKAQDYKTKRKVITELVKPQNLRSSEYVQENYTMMQNLVPEMEAQMNEIMNGFQQADQTVHRLLEGLLPEKATVIRETWDGVKTEQAATYMRFFEIEQDVLHTYRELMTLYHDTQGRFSVDEDGKVIIFENDQDEFNERSIRRDIQLLLEKQSEALEQK